MASNQNLFKTIFLILVTLTTIGLLSFCLISGWWIKIDEKKLQETWIRYQEDYATFNGGLKQGVNEKSRNKEDLTTTTLKSITTTSIANSTSVNLLDTNYDYANYDYSNYDTNYLDSDTPKTDSDSLKPSKRDTKQVDYVYIVKRWPLTKFKSLYSECIEYREFPLKISTAYLVQSKKEPIIGQINYGQQLNALLKSSREINTMNGKCGVGQIRCVLSQECVQGNFCDGHIDCNDQSDEQQCREPVRCQTHEIQCDNKCWQAWHKCDQNPHCSDLSDETKCNLNAENKNAVYSFFARILTIDTNSTHEDEILDFTKVPALNEPFTLGTYHYDQAHNCFVTYFDLKSAKLVKKNDLKYLSQGLADHLQETNNINFHIQLIYALSFLSALIFTFLALFSLLFVLCFKKVCFQCPFWFYGFFNILAWLACFFGVITFLYEFLANKQRTLDPLARLPIDNELIRLNSELGKTQDFGISFWFAVAATSVLFFSSFVSCIVCCRLPTSARHEDKEYKIMQLPTYS